MLDPYFSATKAAWLLRQGGLPLAADDPGLSFCTVDTWVLWNLTGGTRGGAYATDPSNASRTLLLDTATLSWSPELCDLFGVPLPTLPDVRPSAGHFGTAALGDLGPAVRGPRRRPRVGRAGRPAGHAVRTGLLRARHGEGHLRHRQLRAGQRGGGAPARTRWPDRRLPRGTWATALDAALGSVAYALEGSALVSGAAIQWLRDGLGIIAAAADVGPLAASVPDSGGVTFVPALTGLGSPWWDPGAPHHGSRPRRRPRPPRAPAWRAWRSRSAT